MDEKSEKPVLAGDVEKSALQGDIESTPQEVATLTKGGLIVHPQPTADPLDPLNWSKWKKHAILGIVMLK